MKKIPGKPRNAAKRAHIKTPVDKLREEESIVHYSAVMIEEIKSANRLTIEQMTMIRDSLRQEMGELRNDMNNRLGILESAVTINGHRISELRAEIKRVETNLSRKIDGITNRLDDHEERIITIESRH